MTLKRVRVVLTFVLAVVFAAAMFGCGGKQAGIKDEDAIKAIQAAIESNTKGYKLTSPITILERGAKLPSGEFPFKVEYTITLADGSTKKETMTYKISSGGVDSMGVNVWNASESK